MTSNLQCLTTPARPVGKSLKNFLAPVLLRHPDVDLVLAVVLVEAAAGAIRELCVPLIECFKKRFLKQPFSPLAESVAVQPQVAELSRGLWPTPHGK